MITKEQYLENFNFRHACKLFDKNKKIPKEDIDFLLQIARRSPSSFGMEGWKFLVITNDDLKKQIQPYCWDQPQITTSSHLILILAAIENLKPSSGVPLKKFQRRGLSDEQTAKYIDVYSNHLKDTLSSDENIYCWSARQTYIALGNITTAAAFIGIDSCPIEGFEKENIENLLNIDQTKFQLSVILPLGYRKNEQSKQLRADIKDIVEFID